jgi:hypothetical protein
MIKSRRQIGRVQSMYGGEERCIREGDHLEDPGIDGRIILKLILKKWAGGRHRLD